MESRRLLSSLIVSFALVLAPIFASQGFAQSADQVAAVDLAREEAVASEVERLAEELFRLIREKQPTPAGTLLEKAHREAFYQFKRLRVLGDIVKTFGPAPAASAVAVEVIANLVIAPALIATGNPAAAGVVVAGPWGSLLAVGVAGIQVWYDRYKIARDLNVRSLRELDRLRKVIVGYDIKNRISSAVYEATSIELQKDASFEILKKIVPPESAFKPFVTLKELETILRTTPEGSLFLQQVYMQRLHTDFYSFLILRFVAEHPSLSERVADVVSSRSPQIQNLSPEVRQHLIEVDELRKRIAFNLRVLQEDTKKLNGRVKAGELTAENSKILKAHFRSEGKRLQKLRKEIVRHEYGVLLAAQPILEMTDTAALERVVHEFDPALRNLERSTKVAVAPALAAVSTQARPSQNTRALQPRALTCRSLF